MKSVVMCLAVVTVVSALTQQEFKISPEKSREVVEKFAKPCVKTPNADVNSLTYKVAVGTLPRDDVSNEFLYCLTLKAGFIHEDGHINVDSLVALLGDHPLAGETRSALEKCNEVTKENNVQTVVAMNDCIAKTAPVRYVFSL